MAEILRWSSRTARRLFSSRDPGTEQVEVREKVSVSSIKVGGRMDVSVLRDFVAALDEAQISSRAPVEFQVDGGLVKQLVVNVDLDPEQAPPPGPAAEPEPAAAG